MKPRLEELQLFRSQQESRSDVAIVSHKGDLPKKAPQKRKMEARPTEESPVPKKQKAAVHNQTRFAKEASQKSTEENNTASAQKATSHNQTRFAKEATQKATEENDAGSGKLKAENSKTVEEHQITQPPSRETYTDQCTVFISNLSLQARSCLLSVEFFLC